MKILPLLVTLVVLTRPAGAVPVGLFNTGVDNAGVILPGGAVDPHWTVVGYGPAYVVISLPDVWLPNSIDSRWISQNADGASTGTPRVFRTTFDLTGLDLASATIAGRWASDDFGLNIAINGTSIVPPNPPSVGFWQWTDFSIPNAALNPGLNTLDFTLTDVGGHLGLRVEYTTATAPRVPDTGTSLGMLLVGLVALCGLRSRRGPMIA